MPDPHEPNPARVAGAILIGCAAATLVLLASHPGGAAHNFVEVVQDEAANRATDAVVHGGFIVVLGVSLVCQSAFARHLGLGRLMVLAGLIFTCIGSASLAGSMLIDGLVLPDIAARLAAASPAKIEAARPIFVLATTLIRFLMPLGLVFQAATSAMWGLAIAGRISRAAGLAGIAIGALVIAGIAATGGGLDPHVLLASILLLAIWNGTVGMLLFRAGRN
jgi:hypothetical protein